MNRRPGVGRLAMICVAGAFALGVASIRAEGLERDSDDFNCSHGAIEDPHTVEACTRLRGAPVTIEDIAAWRQMGFARADDDWRCHHGRPGASRTRDACRRLRGD